VQFVVFEKFTSAYLFQIAREKSFDYLLILYMQKLEPDSSLIVFISFHGSLAPPTLTLLVENDRLDCHVKTCKKKVQAKNIVQSTKIKFWKHLSF